MPTPSSTSCTTENQTGARRWRLVVQAVLVALLLVSVPGCNYFILLGYLIGGPPQIEPLFERDTKKSMTDRCACGGCLLRIG